MAGGISWHYVLKFIITGPFATPGEIFRRKLTVPPFSPSRRRSGWEVIAADPSYGPAVPSEPRSNSAEHASPLYP